MRRREFITRLGATAVAWPIPLSAQQAVPVIGFLSSRSPGESEGVVAAFRQGLSEAGFVEGKNVMVTFRWAEGRYDRLPGLAGELVSVGVAVLFAAGGTPSARAAQAATSTVPIVLSAVGDPVRLGLVTSLSRPGGNITGMSILAPSLGAKRLEILNDLMPAAPALAFLLNPRNPIGEVEQREAEAVARARRLKLHVLQASTESELKAAFMALKGLRSPGLVLSTEPFFDSQRNQIVGLAARHGVAGVYPWREYVAAGGLASYGASLTDSYRRAGVYTGRVLGGEKPANLPIQQPTKFELLINLKTATALGLTVPPALLARADEVVE